MVNENTNLKDKDVFEILNEVSKATKKEDKIKILQNYNHVWALKDLLKGTFDDRIVWIIPTGNAPYTPCKPESVPSNLRKRYKEFAYFAKGGPGQKLPSFRREQMFIGLIESIHPEDAKLVVGMINKKMPIKGITKKLIEDTFPGLVS